MCWYLQGADIFAAKVNIEVQRASELAIAAVEKNGGVVTTSFYDPRSLGKNFSSTSSILKASTKHYYRNVEL